MKRFSIFSAAVAALSGLAVLLLFFFPSPESDILRGRMLQLAASLGALALLIGITNLLLVHLKKIRAREDKTFQSGVLVAAFAVTFVLAILFGPNASFSAGSAAVQPSNWIFQNIQSPIEISLLALLSVSLIYSTARLLRRRFNSFTVVFMITFVIALLGTSLLVTGGFGQVSEIFKEISDWFARVPAAAGARGILIGVALGAVAAGLRILMGADRPYSG